MFRDITTGLELYFYNVVSKIQSLMKSLWLCKTDPVSICFLWFPDKYGNHAEITMIIVAYDFFNWAIFCSYTKYSHTDETLEIKPLTLIPFLLVILLFVKQLSSWDWCHNTEASKGMSCKASTMSTLFEGASSNCSSESILVLIPLCIFVLWLVIFKEHRSLS